MSTTEVDRLVFSVIRRQPKKLAALVDDVYRAGYGSQLSERMIDRSLQRMRKARKIVFLSKAQGGPGWVRTSKK